MEHFELVSQYAPTGDQPQAIEALVKGFFPNNTVEFVTWIRVMDEMILNEILISYI